MRVFWESHGAKSGPAVVLVQGLGLSSRFWFDQPERLIRAGIPRVVVLDNRGTGRSDKPRRPYRLPQMADDVARVIDEAKAGPATLVGISMGGMIVQHVAMRHPEKVRGLVLLATTPGYPHATLPAPSALRLLMSAPGARGEDVRKINRLLLPESELARAHIHLSRWPEALKHDPMRPETFVRHFLAVMTNWTGNRLRDVDIPAIVIHGKEDILVPPANGEALAALLPRSKLMLLPGVAHAVPTLVPEIIATALARLEVA